MDEENELNKFIATQYNLMDHLTKRVYGDSISYEQLSPFGQNEIAALARLQPSFTEPDPDLQRAKAENALLREENTNLFDRISSLLRDVEELYEENERLSSESEDSNEDSLGGSTWNG